MTQFSQDILETDTLKDSRAIINGRDEALKSNFSGTSFPSVNLVVGMDAYMLEGGDRDPGKYTLVDNTGTAAWRKNLLGTAGTDGDALDISDGGTGGTDAGEARANLEIFLPVSSTTLSRDNGGTSATNGPDALWNLGARLKVTDATLPVTSGGTGTNTPTALKTYLTSLLGLKALSKWDTTDLSSWLSLSATIASLKGWLGLGSAAYKQVADPVSGLLIGAVPVLDSGGKVPDSMINFPTFPTFPVRYNWVEKFSGSSQTVGNSWGEGRYTVMYSNGAHFKTSTFYTFSYGPSASEDVYHDDGDFKTPTTGHSIKWIAKWEAI